MGPGLLIPACSSAATAKSGLYGHSLSTNIMHAGQVSEGQSVDPYLILHLVLPRGPLGGRLSTADCSCSATFSQSALDRQYTMPHSTLPSRSTNFSLIRPAMSSIPSANLAFFLRTSYLQYSACQQCSSIYSQLGPKGTRHVPPALTPMCTLGSSATFIVK